MRTETNNQEQRRTRLPPIDQDAITAMADHELVDILPQLELAVALIRDSLQEARTKVVTERVYSDPDWYRRANFALRMRGREMQMVQREMGKRKRARAVEHKEAPDLAALTWERQFVKTAKVMLTGELYTALCNAATERDRQGGD